MIRMMSDYVLLEPEKPDEKIGRVLLPDTAQKNSLKAKVIAAGPGRLHEDGWRATMQVKVGDTVYYDWGGFPVEYDGKQYLAMRESSIMAVEE